MAWLVGGYVFRHLASALYGAVRPPADLDFVVKKPTRHLELPHGWKVLKNSYGNPKFVKGELIIDYVPIEKIWSFERLGTKVTFENFLRQVPFTVQSIAYSVHENKIVGAVGIKAIQDRHVTILDSEEAEIRAQKRGKSVPELIQQLAGELGFTHSLLST